MQIMDLEKIKDKNKIKKKLGKISLNSIKGLYVIKFAIYKTNKTNCQSKVNNKH